MSYHHHKSAFTLIEVLVALFLLVAVLGAAASAEIFYLNSGTLIKHTYQANNLAQKAFSLIRNLRDENGGLSAIRYTDTAAPQSQCLDNQNLPTSLSPCNNGQTITVGNMTYTEKIYVCKLDSSDCP